MVYLKCIPGRSGQGSNELEGWGGGDEKTPPLFYFGTFVVVYVESGEGGEEGC